MSVLVHFDHLSLRDAAPANLLEMKAVPREGETVTVLGDAYVVHTVHWWASPEDGGPDVRLVLRTPEEYARQRRYSQ